MGTYVDIPIVGPQLAYLSRTELELSDLFEYPIIIPSQDTVARHFYTALLSKHGVPCPSIEASGPDRRIQMTKSNLGISFMPIECVKSEISDHILFPLTINETLLQRKMTLIYSKTRPLSNAAKSFMQMLI